MNIRILAIATLSILSSALHAQTTQPTSFKFAFGTNNAAPGYTKITADSIYSKEMGFGYEPGADLKTSDTGTSSSRPFFFAVAVPQGNYKVTVKLGDAQGPAETTVNAELRRLMIQQLKTAPGEFVTRSFVVNVRQPAFEGGEVRISQRERTSEIWAWNDRLELEFNGSRPSVATVEIEKVDVLTIYLLGDSTVCDQPVEPYNSWGQMFTRFLKPDIAVSNGAQSGDSIAPALGARRFDKFWSQMKQGDYLFIQFGHNDMKSTAPGAIDVYRNNMRRAVDETRKRGGIPVLVTSVSRRSFDADGKKITDSFKGYTDVVREVAKEKEAALIDLQASSATFYEALGPEVSHQAFATMAEGTHHNNYGSYQIAKCIVMGIKEAKLDLVNHISDDFKDFDPAYPDPIAQFDVPKSPRGATRPPLGN